MKIFLTGGTGFIGQPLTKSLLARGWEVTALVRKPASPQAAALMKLGAVCVAGDVTDRESMAAGMAGADIVIHNAAWYELGVSERAQAQMHQINIGGTENVLGLASKLGIPRVVYVSSAVYYGGTGPTARDESYRRQFPYFTHYERTKTEAHELAQDHLKRGLPLIFICPAHVIGPNDHAPFGYFLRLHINNVMPPFAWAAETLFSGVHVHDVASGIALAADKGVIGETYILAGDIMSMEQILQLWATKPGAFRVRFFLPTPLAALLFAPVEPLLRLADLPAFISREVAIGASQSYAFSSAKAQRDLGWSYRPTATAWHEIIDQERKLLDARQRRDLRSRLKPVEFMDIEGQAKIDD